MPLQKPTRAPDDYMVDERDAGAFYGVKPSTMREWRKRNIGPDYVLFRNRTVRYWKSDLIKHAEENLHARPRLKKA